MARLDHYGLLVAINTYPGLTNLAGPENDAAEFARWLNDPAGGDVDDKNIRLILSSDFKPPATEPYDANPTEREVIRALDRWLRKPEGWHDRVGERLYLFFAGHGFTAGSSISDPALFSAVAQNGDTAHIAAYRYASKIANAGFFDEIVLVMDCCQDVLKASAVLEPTWSPPDRGKASKVKLLQAYGAPRGKKAFERALVTGDPVRGLFSSVWIEALRTASADAKGWVTGALVKGRVQQLWGERFRAECDYDPPVRLPDGDDICLLRRKKVQTRGTLSKVGPAAPVADATQVPDTDFVSAAPILGTRSSHEYQHYPAVVLAREAPGLVEPGADAELFVFLRDSSDPPIGFTGNTLRWDGLAIDSLDRDRSHMLPGLLQGDKPSGFASAKLALPAGRYALGIERTAADTEFVVSLPVQLVAGWRTEIYVDCIDPVASDDRVSDRVFDLANAAVLMARIADDSPLESPLGLQTERVRKLLAAGQPVSQEEALGDLLLAIPASPMLGLYAAFRFAMSDQAGRAMECLRRLPGEWRDVSADVFLLDNWCAMVAKESMPAGRSVAGLPMLAASWELAKRMPDGLGLDASLHSGIGQWRLGGSVWGYWQQPKSLVRQMRRELWSRPVEIGFWGRGAGVQGDGLEKTEFDPLDVAYEVSPAPASMAPLQFAGWNADEWHRVAAGLRYPEPTHSPFQQALRRRILDLLAAGDDDWPQDMVADLARTFGLDGKRAMHAYQEVYRGALAAAETLPKPGARKRRPR